MLTVLKYKISGYLEVGLRIREEKSLFLGRGVDWGIIKRIKGKGWPAGLY